jgi:hypothetical protein
MSQRRSRKDEEQAAMISTEVSVEEVMGCLTLDDGKPSPTKLSQRDSVADGPTAPLSIDELYRHERLSAKRKHWKEAPFAAGHVEITWRDEDCCCGAGSGRSGPSVAGLTSSEIDPDSSGCLWCSGLFCPRIGAGRVGNMAVLYQVQEWVEQVEEDEETGEKKIRRFTRPRLVWLMGPYWPMLLFVTYPLIFVVSLWTLATSIPRVSPIIQVVWAILTLGLIYALAMTAFRDPGILHRHTEAPPGLEQSWRWCDAAQTYRPRGAVYDPDCAVVVEDFDHT